MPRIPDSMLCDLTAPNVARFQVPSYPSLRATHSFPCHLVLGFKGNSRPVGLWLNSKLLNDLRVTS